MRSPGPVDAIAAASSPLSATSLRTAGPERASADAAPPSPASPRIMVRGQPSPALRERVDPAGTARLVRAGVGPAATPSGRVALDVACSAGSGRVASSGVGCAAGTVALSPIRPSTAPTGRLAPSAATISASVPAAGAGTSTLTLSVSSSTTGSSTATASPGCFSHFATVASVTNSPRLGTLISIAIAASPKIRRRGRR